MRDHVHMLVSIPPKYSVSQVVGYMKGKSAIHIARTFMGKPRNFTGESFWARGYLVSTVGRDEKQIREHIQKQEQEGPTNRLTDAVQQVATSSGP
jgi:REP-associated tyrosine transposase